MNKFEVPMEDIAVQRDYSARVRSLGGGRVFIRTFGCQQNEADSERLAGMAAAMGYSPVDTPAEADLIIVNTCAIREHAELKTLSVTGQFKHIKEKNPSLVIVMCGCMVSQKGRIDDIKRRYPYVDLTFGTESLHRFPELLFGVLTDRRRAFYPNSGDGVIAEGVPVLRQSAFEAWVSIMYGCNNFCTYCVVPYVRGRERSRAPQDIVREVAGLAADGCREITLLGQNVNSYGAGSDDGVDFAALLRMLCDIPGDFLLRFMTSNPGDVSPALIGVIAENRRMARHFHLPAQSGSDRVLRAMNRRYTRGEYLNTVAAIRAKVPDIALTTDIIVGFPGETDEEFEDTLSLLREVRFANIYSFIYSPRPGTPAAVMDGQISPDVSRERFARLLETQNEISLEQNRALEGQTLRALVLGESKTDPEKLTARTERGRLVHFEGDRALTGSYASLRITRGDTYALYGEIADCK